MRIPGPGGGSLLSGTAALARSGVSADAAMQYEITDSAAIAFTRGFCAAIARHRGVDDAVSSGRVAILGISDQAPGVGHLRPGEQVEFSQDGRLLATTSADKTVRLWG